MAPCLLGTGDEESKYAKLRLRSSPGRARDFVGRVCNACSRLAEALEKAQVEIVVGIARAGLFPATAVRAACAASFTRCASRGG